MSSFQPLLTPPEASGPALWILSDGNRVLVDPDRSRLPDSAALRDLAASFLHPLYIGRLDGQDCHAAEWPASQALPAGYVWQSLRALLSGLPAGTAQAVGLAVQLLEWDRSHQFCGRCGQATRRLETERARACPACGFTAWPRLNPAVMVVVCRPGQLLLARQASFPAGRYSAVAGFVEAGETVEAAAHREVREEVGVAITRLRYFGSQSWPFPHQLMLAFLADYAGGDLMPDGNEIEAADWFAPTALPDLPEPYTLSRRLIEAAAAELSLQHPGRGENHDS